MSIFYDKPLTPTSGKSEKEWFTIAKKSVGQAALAVTAVGNVGKTIVDKAIIPAAQKIGSVAKTSYVNTFTKAPITTGAVTLVAGGYTLANPKGAVEDIAQAPSSAVNFGGNIRDLKDNPTKENLVKIGIQSPVISGLVVGGTGYFLGKGAGYLLNALPDSNPSTNSSSIFGVAGDEAAKKASSYKDTIINNIPDNIIPSEPKPSKEVISGMPAIAPQPAAILPTEVTTKSYGSSSGVRKIKAKRKPLNTNPITVRNTVNIFNKN